MLESGRKSPLADGRLRNVKFYFRLQNGEAVVSARITGNNKAVGLARTLIDVPAFESDIVVKVNVMNESGC